MYHSNLPFVVVANSSHPSVDKEDWMWQPHDLIDPLGGERLWTQHVIQVALFVVIVCTLAGEVSVVVAVDTGSTK